jgi:hypothetical protein
VTPGAIAETESGGLGAISLDGDRPDREARIPALLKSRYPLKSDAVAVPEPDSD